jgi:hypothetical protein
MPSASELRARGLDKLAAIVAYRGGFAAWRMRLALEAKRSETYRGRAVEEQAVQFLERSGFKVEHQRAAKCPFDIMVNGSVRVDVKAARLNSAGKYTFGTKKPRPTCDVYMLGMLNKRDVVRAWYLVPATQLPTCAHLRPNDKRYEKYRGALTYLDPTVA